MVLQHVPINGTLITSVSPCHSICQNNIVASETQSIGTMLSDKLHSMNPRLHKLPAWIKEAIPQGYKEMS